MLRITMELISANTGKVSNLGTVLIANDGTGTKNKGNYKAVIFRKGSKKAILRQVEINDFPRLRLTSWDLLFRVLGHAFAIRNIGWINKGKRIDNA